ncbi:helix-turn-helix domain-containing protein [Bradyrhizobium barranii subsp. barranii]|uniref:Helix-turn-helix domain-containing protein n=1 Tax=Bradyrhizobium barranii subsp. barranii TaxID=2823807 RepID=A0A939MAF2_9BRAD|nr:helix-turn-helix transcriptional regulator [Bradyrhizobium barranii]UEM17060.1 helix-turn-helix domain-containing protein [Bradyrhizobium barranii subsp. barranii]
MGTLPRRKQNDEALGFGTEAYVRRLRLLREMVSGENQKDFARRVGVSTARWNNYEQGYPMGRAMALQLMDRIPGMSIEWLWFGKTGNLSDHFRTQLMNLERFEAARRHQHLLYQS